MHREKLSLMNDILLKQHFISFYLFNAEYIISINNNVFSIRQINSNLKHEYSSIVELFSNYRIYGQNLLQLFNNIHFK